MSISDRIHTTSMGEPVALTMTSVRWPAPRVTTFVVYGWTGT